MNTASVSSRLLLDPVLPVPLLAFIGLLIGAATLVVYLRDRRVIGTGRCLVLSLLRIMGLGGLFFILLNPQREVTEAPQKLDQTVIIAIDSSGSMHHSDDGAQTRLDVARQALDRSGLVQDGAATVPGLELYTFDEDARPIDIADLAGLKAEGTDTRFHRSVGSLLNSKGSGEALVGIILISDGHDFELMNPARTALEARGRNSPIFALPLGSDKPVRDAAVRIASYQPYVFAGQHSRIDAALRLIGCEYEDFTLDLYREGERIARRQVSVGEELQRLESFQVLEETPGQYAYELRLSTVRDEIDLENNRATTFLNVSDKKINLLILEGSPYWDTNFTQRSLWGNDKFFVDTVVALAPGKVRTLRKDAALGALTIPETPEGFDAYDCILLGNHVDRLLNENARAALAAYVRDFGGNVVFMRGQPMDEEGPLSEIAPVEWGKVMDGFGEIEVDRAGRSIAPFELLNVHTGQRTLRPLLGVQEALIRPLATVLARSRIAGSSEPVPVMVHRRAGRGQVLAIASTGLWRTGFHGELPASSNLFDQFWDNIILWLIAGRTAAPGGDFSVMLSTANLAVDQTLHIRMTAADPEALPAGVPIEIYRIGEREPIERIALSPADPPTRLTASFTPKQAGIYQTDIALPSGEVERLRFAVFRDDRERTEVSADRQYLERLSNQSGGRLIEAGELKSLVTELLQGAPSEPLKRREPIWSIAILAWVIIGFFSADWLLRRRWGLC